MQSSELLHDRIHIAVNSLSLNEVRSNTSQPKPDLRTVLQAKRSAAKKPWDWWPRAYEGSPHWGRAAFTAVYGARLAPVPLGDRSANPAMYGFPGRSDLQRAHISVYSARKHSGAEMLATPSGVSGVASSAVPCRCAVPGRRPSRSDYTTRGSHSLKEGGHRDGSSSWKRVRVLQLVLHSSKEGWRVASHFRSASVEPLSQQTEVQDADTQVGRVSNQVRGLVCRNRSKDAYFHVSILPTHRKFLRFAFGGKAYQYRVLPFGLALSPRTFTKCVDAALAPLRLQGIRILNYIDDWLILTQSERVAPQNRDVVLAHLKVFGIRLNAKKSLLSPLQRTTYLGVVRDSTTMQARMSPGRIESILTEVRRVKEGQSVTVKQFQRLLGLMAAASSVIPIGLLYMRPLQWWLKTKGFSPRGNLLRMIKVTRRCLRALDMWRQPWFLSQGPALGAPCRRVTLATDASLTGWGAVMSGHPVRSLWRGQHLAWHINRLEMLAVFQALRHFLPDLRNHHVLMRTDNTAVVSYINHQGGLRSRPLYRLAHQILVWSQSKLLSLRAVYIPGHLNVGADSLSRQGPWPGEWMLHPEVVKHIWRVFGQAQVDLFATQETAQCPLWYSLVHPAPLGLDAMVQMWPRLRLYAFPPIALLPGVLERVCRDGVRLLLVAPFWPGRVWFSDLISLLDGSPWEIPVRSDLLSQAGGTLVHPRPELWKLWVWPLRGHSS